MNSKFSKSNSKFSSRLLYMPKLSYVLTDLVLLALSFFVVLMWFPLNTQIPFQKYWIFAIVFSFVWLLSSYLCHRYVKVKFQRIGNSALRLLTASMITFGIMYGYMYFMAPEHNYSINVLLTIWIAMFVWSVVFLLLFHAYHYALNVEPQQTTKRKRGTIRAIKKGFDYSPEAQQTIRQQLLNQLRSESTLNFLEQHVNLYNSNTVILSTNNLRELKSLPRYRYETIINLMPLNNIRGINKMFGTINDALPDNGLIVCSFEPQGMMKQRILNRYWKPFNWIFYSFFFLYKRVLPKLFMTSRLYYDITEGRNRVLSKPEVLGRLCYCGYNIVAEAKRDGLVWVVAERVVQPRTTQRRYYGMFISLPRIGKNGKIIKVYKFRTMHPYAEYLQDYVYKRYNLQSGGKFRHDIRVTTLGRLMRRTWIDELPMLLNLLKGEMKIVGVRPLSRQYYMLYSTELQQMRIKFKPGLLPPFYVDLPQNLEEIEASEMRYLNQCQTRGVFRTDVEYFFKIIYTILFKRARSK